MEKFTDLFSNITEEVKKHPIISWILSIVPVVGLSYTFINTYFSNTYNAKIQEYRLLVDRCNQENIELNNADVKIQSSTDNDISSNGFEEVQLNKNLPKLLNNGKLRLTVNETYPYLGLVNITAYFEDKKVYLPNISLDERKKIIIADYEFYLDIHMISDSYIKASITPIQPKP